MTDIISAWERLKTGVNRFIARQLIQLKWVKQETYTAEQLNELFSTVLPHTIPLQLPAGEGELELLECELSIPKQQNALHIKLYCGFEVRVAEQDIYRAHLSVCGTVIPYYVESEQAIRLKATQVDDIRLIQDDYAFIKSTPELVTMFLPEVPGVTGVFKNMLSGTVEITFALLKGVIPRELYNYLLIFSGASKQKVLDFHKPEIERQIIKKVEQEDWFYKLDQAEWGERLFAELGKEVVVEDGLLVFKFHSS